MKFLALFVGTTLLLVSSNLIDYRNEDYHMEVTLPEGFKIEENTVEEKFATVKSLRIAGQQEISNGLFKGNLMYRVVCQKFASKPAFRTQKLNLHEMIGTYARYKNDAAIVGNKFEVLEENEQTDTLFYVLTNDTKALIEHRKIIVHDSITYMLSFSTHKQFFRKEDASAFFMSLKIE
jgi:hypothetical protein